MDAIKPIISGVKTGGLTKEVNEILSQLQRAGLFRAIVSEKQGNQVILDTAFGKLSGKAPNNLHKGDEILARMVENKAEPTVKIEQHNTKILRIQNQALKGLFTNDSSSPQIARVIAQTGNKTQLLINDKSYNIPRQGSLQSGEILLLTPTKNQQLQIQRIQPEAILRNALSTLLPKGLRGGQDINLASLQKLASELVAPKPELLLARLAQGVQSAGGNPLAAAKASDLLPRLNTTGLANSTKMAGADIKQLLNQVAAPLARLDGVKADTVQQLLSLLSLLKITSPGTASSTSESVPNQLSTMMRELVNYPESFRNLVQQIFNQHASQGKLQTDHSLQDITNVLRNELVQQTEQTLNQLLIQKTNVRLQTEQNQPIQINLNIPIQVHNESRNLKLSIKQKQKSEIKSEQHWEIRLSFEFGLLGLISSHLLLQENKLSAHFWAVEKSTKSLISQNLENFKTQLRKSGFELGLFDCFHGQPAEEQTTSQHRTSENLLDVKA